MTDNNTDDNNGHEVFLKPDPPIRNQEWVCLSIITPETVKNSKIHAIKIEVSMLPKMKQEIGVKN